MFGSLKALQRVRECEERLDTLTSKVKNLQVEWESAYDKFVAIVQRITKRARVVEQATEAAEGEGAVQGPRPVLSREEQLQEQILARRRKIDGIDRSA